MEREMPFDSYDDVLEHNIRSTEHEGYQDNSQAEVSHEPPSLEQQQHTYYKNGQKDLEDLQLLDLSPLATWKLSSFKKGYGIPQLRADTPDLYWQSDGSSGNNMEHQTNDGGQLSHPHSITLQFSKKVSLERICIFTNYQLDESYTPSKIKVMAGGSIWDLTDVCVVKLEKPIGWSHIVFNGVRADGLLKCFVVRIIVLANHQDGKDSHIRAVRCLGKKSHSSMVYEPAADKALKQQSVASGFTSVSGISLNNHSFGELPTSLRRADSLDGISIEETDEENLF
ncbi:hypothetical protein CXQ85_005304 [Candidozyma haemuli]|uniref:DOC domain-containing protein n=1 Tax=Candidozyma haemuli TaxID=45357 RepID=A0A2V1AVZ8_9ASCO|nr:hypothetical protein CXQ85_005304 [[Candida] haemuloni]PVH22277.1 hypothetical protein CXQ85_005304 [[Candida] haemuloni]